ncbi:DIP1984 family protein [Corynebacterium sp. SCR221107]|uniref:DIP1984 family protein n=1 Tax=Corynebacterium sp. SCR221107 TaxID=3017361 RepID=UPI0022EC98ED|nr:DIP1984 family protein [Corynebacterium sp. SCR221107]WBT08416.1 DIP1984 family protein [Corynebacterium sp. SCR221107]
MLLAEALAERAEAQNRLKKLTERLAAVSRVQEGDTPEENPEELLAEAEALFGHIESLIRRINATNLATAFDEQRTLTDAIAQRDSALLKRRFYTQLADSSSARRDRYTRNEIRYVTTLPVAQLRAKADEASKQYRLLDTRIQRLNWLTELQ